jgi:hypothetical protein
VKNASRQNDSRPTEMKGADLVVKNADEHSGKKSNAGFK